MQVGGREAVAQLEEHLLLVAGPEPEQHRDGVEKVSPARGRPPQRRQLGVRARHLAVPEAEEPVELGGGGQLRLRRQVRLTRLRGGCMAATWWLRGRYTAAAT